MIISGGENIYPAEIEDALMKLDGVSDAAVIGVPGDRCGEMVKAVITLVAEGLSQGDVISHCRKIFRIMNIQARLNGCRIVRVIHRGKF